MRAFREVQRYGPLAMLLPSFDARIEEISFAQETLGSHSHFDLLLTVWVIQTNRPDGFLIGFAEPDLFLVHDPDPSIIRSKRRLREDIHFFSQRRVIQ